MNSEVKNEGDSSSRRPIEWLIIGGFALASLFVIIFSVMSYRQVWSLIDVEKNPDASYKYINYVNFVFETYDKASMALKNEALFAEKRDLASWVELSQVRQELVRLDSVPKGTSDSIVKKIVILKNDLYQRYNILEEVQKLAEPIGEPSAARLKDKINWEDQAKLQELFQSLRMDKFDPLDPEEDLGLDSTSYEGVFPELLSYTQLAAERSQRIAELFKKEKILEATDNQIKSGLETYLNKTSKGKSNNAFNNAGNVSTAIGFSSVLVIVFCIAILIKIIRDVERNRQLEEELKRQKLRAEELAKAKEEFLANMSHEMRTPMNAIIGFSSQLAETSLNTKQDSLLKPIRHSADFLLALINDILDYSKLEAGKLELGSEHFRLKRVVNEVGQLFLPKSNEKGIELIIDIADNVPEVVVGDELKLKQMLMNLGGNAVKFTDRGSVTIRVESLNKDARPHQVLFQVIDTGIGIPMEQQDRIFKDFIQVDSSNTRRYGGTGLGLSITKKLAELHGGEIQLESKEGKGTKVMLLLNYDGGDPAKIYEKDENPVLAHPELAGKRVLLADDEPYNRMLVRGILESWKMEVTSAVNGKEVLEALQPPELYSVLLMDLQMPELDGVGASRKIREEMGLDIPILALTATSSPREQQKAIEAGMQKVMLKPFKAQELHDVLLSLMNIQARKKKIIPGIPKLNKSDENPFPDLYKVTRGDKGMMRKMLEQYLSLSQSNYKGLMEAYEEKDSKKLALISHRMIPANRHLGFHSIVNNLKRIEELGEKELFTPELDQLLGELESWLDSSKEKVNKVLEESI
ncbi:MAG: ATP-binding protein [Bacteroidia bacterium]|nr:ATP-binding protein [Bacteroidia bacterium]